MVMDYIDPIYGLDKVLQTNPRWLRSNTAITWALVEPTQGARNWGALSLLEIELSNLAGKGVQPILAVRAAPTWAQKDLGYPCSPVKADKFAAFASFMHDAVARYSVPPYNVKYWEIWNEPDMDHNSPDFDPNGPYGCWGDASDPYFGGGYYADMLKVVYPQIKAANPDVQVLVGGLAMDCDPRPGASCEIYGVPPAHGKFFEGILHNGGGPFFDGVSFHSYDYYKANGDQTCLYANPRWQSAWNTTGPVVALKAAYIKSVLKDYGFSNKFLMDSENALVAMWNFDPKNMYPEPFETIKAYFVAETYAAALSQGVLGNLWYSWLGWYNSGLVKSDLTPLPAYTALQFSSNELHNAVFMRNITDYPGVKGYEFYRFNRRVWVLWSLDGNAHSISLTNAPLAIWDALGVSIPASPSVTITTNPSYLEWNP
jgi:hypothetical protein